MTFHYDRPLPVENPSFMKQFVLKLQSRTADFPMWCCASLGGKAY